MAVLFNIYYASATVLHRCLLIIILLVFILSCKSNAEDNVREAGYYEQVLFLFISVRVSPKIGAEGLVPLFGIQ